MNTSMIILEKKNHVAIITLPGYAEDQMQRANLCNQLSDICTEIAWNEDIRAVVLFYSGGSFQPAKDTYYYSDTESYCTADSIAKLKQPVIAGINGDIAGPDLELAIACDIRIGTEEAFFGLPQIHEGLMPFNGGTQRLPRLVGHGKALEMILTGEKIDATEALRIGLINRIVSQGELMNKTMSIANEIASKSTLAVSYVKEALYNGIDLTLDQGMRMELDLYLLLFTTEDRVEGITAFKEKRKPKFKGQ